jgi:hypothetical protein
MYGFSHFDTKFVGSIKAHKIRSFKSIVDLFVPELETAVVVLGPSGISGGDGDWQLASVR